MDKIKEPKFMQEIHKIRVKLSKMPPKEYERYIREAREKNAERLKILYVDLPLVKLEKKIETVTRD